MESEWLEFYIMIPKGRKTKIINVWNRKTDCYLGNIQWSGAWRQYVFMPMPDRQFSRGCMEDIIVFIKILMEERKK